MSPEPPTGLSREFIEQQRRRLLALRRQLLGAEHTAEERQRGFQLEHGDEAEEEEEQAQDLSRREVAQALHDADDRRLANVERALQKIDEDSYGRSDLSGEPIPLARLQTTPEAVLTVQEERAREAHG